MLTSGTSLVQQVHIRATTASSSSTSGALVVSGGAGIQGNVNVGGMLLVVGDMDGVVVRSYMAV
jgi:hypothetical protein